MIEPTTAIKATGDLVKAGGESNLTFIIAIFVIAVAAIIVNNWVLSVKISKSLEKIFDRIDSRDTPLTNAIIKLADNSADQAKATTALTENIKSNQFCPLQRVGQH